MMTGNSRNRENQTLLDILRGLTDSWNLPSSLRSEAFSAFSCKKNGAYVMRTNSAECIASRWNSGVSSP